MAQAGLVWVVVMVSLDDVLVVGRGKTNTCEQPSSRGERSKGPPWNPRGVAPGMQH